MKLKMAENSLFAILLRKPWWLSIALAVLLTVAASAMLPRTYAAYGVSAGLPFLVIGIIAAARQWRTPSAARLEQVAAQARAMSWREFSDALEQAYRRQSYEVTRRAGAADFELARAGRLVVVAGKRWKAAGIGIEPLRELQAAAEARGAHEAVFIALGQFSDNARQFAAEKKIHLAQASALAELLQT